MCFRERLLKVWGFVILKTTQNVCFYLQLTAGLVHAFLSFMVFLFIFIIFLSRNIYEEL